MRAIITVVGKDTVGILAKVSQICSKEHVNIMDVTQSIMQDMFVMIMMVDISSCAVPFSTLQDELEAAGSEMNLKGNLFFEKFPHFLTFLWRNLRKKPSPEGKCPSAHTGADEVGSLHSNRFKTDRKSVV